MRQTFLMTAIALLFLTACESNKFKEKSEAKARIFFKALKQEDIKKCQELYTGFKNLDSYYKSDSVSVNYSLYKDNITTVSLNNRFTNGFGKLSEREILLFFKKDSTEQVILFDTKGMSNFSDKNEFKFASKTGCITPSDTTDQQIFVCLKRADKVMLDKALDVYLELKRDIRVVDWNWESGYSGSASGKGIVANNSTFSIPSLKYTITYKTNSGRPITTDKGSVSYDAIPSGGSTSFSFYTDYVGDASSATIELEFSDDLIFNYLADKDWTGKECDEYFKKHLDSVTNDKKVESSN